MKAGQQAAPEKKPRRRVKKVGGHGGHHGGAWKVAYADFVTAMMALFLVLWLVSQADTKLKESIANYFRSPGVFTATRGGILKGQSKISPDPGESTEQEALLSAAITLQKKLEKGVQFKGVKDQVKIDVIDEGLRIQILDKADRVSFNSGSADLAQPAREILTEVAQAICELSNPIYIGGHTDRSTFPAGSTYTNWELSADRANAARRALEGSCVKPEQIRRVIGFADTELLVPDDPYAPANRRISIIVRRENPLPEPRRTGFDSGRPKDKSKSSDDSPSSTKSSEKSLGKAKLEREGSISVGEADKPPEGVKRTRESKTNEHEH